MQVMRAEFGIALSRVRREAKGWQCYLFLGRILSHKIFRVWLFCLLTHAKGIRFLLPSPAL